MDKSLTFAESTLGSSLKQRLLIRSEEGEEFWVIVDESVYDQAKVGNWIRANEKRTELEEVFP